LDLERTLPRDAVLAAFRGCGVSVTEVRDDRGRVLVTFVRGWSAVEVQLLPDLMPLRQVLRLAEKFSVPEFHFLAPGEMLAPDTSKPC
jgi:hypothetical protein